MRLGDYVASAHTMFQDPRYIVLLGRHIYHPLGEVESVTMIIMSSIISIGRYELLGRTSLTSVAGRWLTPSLAAMSSSSSEVWVISSQSMSINSVSWVTLWGRYQSVRSLTLVRYEVG